MAPLPVSITEYPPGVDEVNVQFEVCEGPVAVSVTLVQETVSPVEGVIDDVNEIVSAKPPVPATVILSVPV